MNDFASDSAGDDVRDSGSDSIWVRSIRIGRMPGIRQAFSLEDLSPGVNILHGPNGVGKTSVGRATVLALFNGSESVWERLVPGDGTGAARELRRLEIEADFAFHGADGRPRSWQVSVEAGTPDSKVDGVQQTLSVGSPELAQRYRMGLAELLVESNDEFAREILRQAAGGIDLAAVVKRLRWDVPVAKPRDSKDSELRRTRKELLDAEASQANLDRSAAAEIAALQRESTDLRERQVRGRAIAAAIDGLAAGEKVRDIESRIEEIPEATRKVDAGADRQADELAERLRAARHQHDDAARRLDDRLRLAPALTEEEIHAREVDLSTARARVDDLRQAESELAKAKVSEEDARSRLRSAEDVLSAGEIAEREPTDRVDAKVAAAADEIASLVHAARAKRAQHEELQRQFVATGWRDIAKEGLPDAADLRLGLDTLGDWCKAVDPAATAGSAGIGPGSPSPKWVWPVLLALAIGSLILTALGWYAAAIGIPAAALAAWLAWRAGAAGDAPATVAPETSAIEAKFTRMVREGIALPRAWTVEAVGERIDELVRRLTERTMHDAANPIRERLKDLERQAGAAERLAHERCLGFEDLHRISIAKDGPLPAEGWMRVMVQAIAAWRNATHDLREAQDRRNRAEVEATERRDELGRELGRAGLGGKIGSQRISSNLGGILLDALQKCREDFKRDVQLERNHRDDLQRSKEHLTEVEEAVRSFWEDLGLTRDDRGGLQRRLEERERFRELDEQLGAARAREKDLRAELADRSDLLDRGRDALERERQSLEGIDHRLSQIDQRVGDLKGQVERAALGHDVSAKQLAVRRANDDLLQRERNRAAAQVRDQVVAWARESMQQGVVTPVVGRARPLLAEFTRGELDFEVRAGDRGNAPSLRAKSISSPEWRTVERLSSGERIQLLMAIRLAFLEESEERKLPIFLDEVLGSSDDERARCIIDAVIAIAATGRQVFYATAQADEVAKWQTRLEDARRTDGKPEFRIVDVAAARGLASREAFPLAEPLPEPKPLPSPVGRSHADYGRDLGVPGVDWSEPGLGSLHPWHVLEDPALLHEILRQGLSTLARVERVAAFERSGPLADARESMRAAACAYRAAGDAWRIGRGRPITRAAIEEADGVSDRFRDRIWSIVQQVGGEARGLMRQLRENPPERWRQTSTLELEAWLRSEGHLLDEDPLDPEEIMNRALEELAQRDLRTTTSPETLRRLGEMIRAGTRA